PRWVLKLCGEVLTEASARVSESYQSTLRIQVRTPIATMITLNATGATIRSRSFSPRSYTNITAHAANPIDGKYRKRSAIIVPVKNNRLVTGRIVTNANAPKKKYSRFRVNCQATATITALTAIHATPSW